MRAVFLYVKGEYQTHQKAPPISEATVLACLDPAADPSPSFRQQLTESERKQALTCPLKPIPSEDLRNSP